MTLTVEEASATYSPAMRNVPADGGTATCRVCREFIDPQYDRCYKCRFIHPEAYEVVVPISYSKHAGQLHLALRNYKNDLGSATTYAEVRLRAILWRFLEDHESCIAAHVGGDRFDVVTTVPSSDPEREQSSRLRGMLERCPPVADRLERLLRPTGNVPADDRTYHADRFEALRSIEPNETILVIDDTWTSGSRAESAGIQLLSAGAARIALLVIGRHLQPGWKPVKDEELTCGEIFDGLPAFDWSVCAANPH